MRTTYLCILRAALVRCVLGAALASLAVACGPEADGGDLTGGSTLSQGSPSPTTAAVESAVSVAPQGPVFPLKASSNGHYLVDQNGKPFRIHGEASWDAHIDLALADVTTYLSDRQAKGINALFTYVANPVAYFAGASSPWAVQLGGRAAGVNALPFTKNASGGAWDGDPTFAHHDASFASPNDAYFAWVAQFVDAAASRGMVVLLCPMYLGDKLGASDGWYQTLMNAANTQAVANAFGQYLANGHGSFTGFKGRPNIIWVEGGDTLPASGSEGSLRALQVLEGLRQAGDTHLQTAHWQDDVLTLDETDFAPFMTAYAAYTHGNYGALPAVGPTYAESAALYAQPTARPVWLIETNYWGEHGASASDVRFFSWGAELSAIGGVTFAFTPFWSFVTSPDGSTGKTTAWVAETQYPLDQYVSKGGNWYRATTAGVSGATGPSGKATSVADGTVTWTYVATGNWSALLNEPAVLDFQRLGAFFNQWAWYKLVPSGQPGMQTLITAGGGTHASWSDGNPETGGMDWITSAAASDGTFLVAYVPDAHAGSFAVAMSALSGLSRARWYDPTNGSFVADSSGTGYSLPNSGTHTFATPGSNSAGAKDWVLVLDTRGALAAPALPSSAYVFVLAGLLGVLGAFAVGRRGSSSGAHPLEGPSHG
jgi:hypothetical protein